MSWLARSIANTLKLDEDDGEEAPNPNQNQVPDHSLDHTKEQNDDPSSPASRGVKEDISELKKTLTRQFWGVASFLAPPPQSEVSDSHEKSELTSDLDESEQVGTGGIRSDFAEIGGKFRSGISMLSSNIAVSEFTKIASNILQLGSDNEEEVDEKGLGRGAIGVTEEVVAFAKDISMHPGTWLDFPLPGDEDDDNFDLSDAQQEHALAVEHLAPMLAALRMELCPGYMSESCFWKIYFVLLHPRLDKEDAALLSTQQVLEARALLSQQLPSRTMEKLPGQRETGAGDTSDSSFAQLGEPLNVQPQSDSENVRVTTEKLEASASVSAYGPETDKHPVTSSEIEIVDKSIIEDKHVNQIKDGHLPSASSKVLVGKDEDDYDDWLKEESSELGGTSAARANVENEEDVSFSDLEEDEDEAPARSTRTGNTSNTRDWVQLTKASSDSSKRATTKDPESKESTDWLDVDIDVA